MREIQIWQSKLGKIHNNKEITKIADHLHDYFVVNGDRIFGTEIGHNTVRHGLNDKTEQSVDAFIFLIEGSRNLTALVDFFENVIVELKKMNNEKKELVRRYHEYNQE